MPRAILSAIIFCGFALFCASPLSAQGGPDSIYIPGKGYVEPWQASGVKAARHFGGYTKKAKRKSATVAGKRFTPSASVSFYSSAAPWLAEAQRHLGTNPTGKKSLWCADFVNLTLARTGRRGTGSRAARSFTSYGARLSGPRPGAIAVYSRGRRGGHVAIVESVNGNTVTLVSGNCGRKGVCRYTRSAGAALEYRWPS